MSKRVKAKESIKGAIAITDPEIPFWTCKIPKKMLDELDEARLKLGYNKRVMIQVLVSNYLGGL